MSTAGVSCRWILSSVVSTHIRLFCSPSVFSLSLSLCFAHFPLFSDSVSLGQCRCLARSNARALFDHLRNRASAHQPHHTTNWQQFHRKARRRAVSRLPQTTERTWTRTSAQEKPNAQSSPTMRQAASQFFTPISLGLGQTPRPRPSFALAGFTLCSVFRCKSRCSSHAASHHCRTANASHIIALLLHHLQHRVALHRSPPVTQLSAMLKKCCNTSCTLESTR